jgi:hypothetical protein
VQIGVADATVKDLNSDVVGSRFAAAEREGSKGRLRVRCSIAFRYEHDSISFRKNDKTADSWNFLLELANATLFPDLFLHWGLIPRLSAARWVTTKPTREQLLRVS